MSLPLDQEGEGARSEAIHNCLSLVVDFLLWFFRVNDQFLCTPAKSKMLLDTNVYGMGLNGFIFKEIN